MDYRKTKEVIAVRLDDGDEINECLTRLCKKEKITGAIVTGVGCARLIEIGHYHSKKKIYHRKRFEGTMEIVSLNGNIAVHEGMAKPHLHIVAGTHDMNAVAGHLLRAEVHPTCEIMLIPFKMKLGRKRSEEHEINLLSF